MCCQMCSHEFLPIAMTNLLEQLHSLWLQEITRHLCFTCTYNLTVSISLSVHNIVQCLPKITRDIMERCLILTSYSQWLLWRLWFQYLLVLRPCTLLVTCFQTDVLPTYLLLVLYLAFRCYILYSYVLPISYTRYYGYLLLRLVIFTIYFNTRW